MSVSRYKLKKRKLSKRAPVTRGAMIGESDSDDGSFLEIVDSDSDDSDVQFIGYGGGYNDQAANMDNFAQYDDDYDNNNPSTYFNDSDSEYFDTTRHTTEQFWFGHLVVPISSASAAADPDFGNLWARFRNASFNRFRDDMDPGNLDLAEFGNVAGALRNPNSWNLDPADYKELLRSIVDRMENL